MGTLRIRSFCTVRLAHSALLICLLSVVSCGGSSSDNAEILLPLAENEVATAQGIISGSIAGDLRMFHGVRYAAALAPETRFMAPAAAPAFSGTYDATLNGPACAQPEETGVMGEEDCLYANIWAHRDSTLRPVMVFLHGGASGGVSGSMASIDGALLASSTGMVVVTANRRLGVLGNLALEQLIAENPRGTAGNYEVLDTIQVLKWVQQNARAFNGDPNRVMLVGNSYGGRVVCHIVAAPEAAGLFQSVAIISGACGDRSVLSANVQAFTRNPMALDEHPLLLAAVGCEGAADVLQCLRALDVAELIAAELLLEDLDMLSRDLFEPVIDGVVVQSDPYTALQNQVVGDIPVIVGSTQDDVEFMFRRTNVPDDATYRSELFEVFAEPLASEIYSIYPAADFATLKDAYVTMWSDLLVNCVAEELARSAASGASSYLYLLSRGFDNGRDAGRGATHAIDVIYLFESFAVWNTVPDAQALNISAAMQAGWANLAVDPLGMPAVDTASGLLWPPYEPAAKPHIDFGDPVRVATGYRSNRCDRLRAVVQL